jgi:hypothetical protein
VYTSFLAGRITHYAFTGIHVSLSPTARAPLASGDQWMTTCHDMSNWFNPQFGKISKHARFVFFSFSTTFQCTEMEKKSIVIAISCGPKLPFWENISGSSSNVENWGKSLNTGPQKAPQSVIWFGGCQFWVPKNDQKSGWVIHVDLH